MDPTLHRMSLQLREVFRIRALNVRTCYVGYETNSSQQEVMTNRSYSGGMEW